MGSSHPAPRVATLVLCLPDGTVLGALPPLEVALPWWSEAASVVEAARDAHGLDVVILRLLHAEAERAPGGGPVTYLAEVAAPPPGPLLEWDGDISVDDSLRMSWARPGGPAADLAWADAVLAGHGTPRRGHARQIRTWNLSSLWQLPLEHGAAWLKVVPPFFAHEGAILTRLGAAVTPAVIATEGPRTLLDEIPGADQYEAVGETLLRMVRLLVALQRRWVGRSDEVLALGLPDWRPPPFERLAADVVERTSAELDADTAARLQRLLGGLDRRQAELAACGIPPSLVHGDFHRGNVRGDADRLVLLDWGDSGVGHPLLDQSAFIDRLPADERPRVRAEWS